MRKRRTTKDKHVKKTLDQSELSTVFSYTKGLFVDYLQKRLGQPIIVRPIKQELTKTGLHRTTIIGTREVPIYYAITFVKRIPRTRALIKTMLKHPTMPFGDALKKHHLFGRKTDVTVSVAPYVPMDNRFDTDDSEPHPRETWERLYTIVSPKGEPIASVLEIAPPKKEKIYQAALAAKQKRTARQAKRRTKHKPHISQRKSLHA